MMTIRSEATADHDAIRQVHRLAFGQDDEANIVEALSHGGHTRVSLVAECEGMVVGHLLFSDLPILTDSGTIAAVSLAPLAVRPEWQRQGIGSALVVQGLEACRERGHRIVVVLGHPEYYSRFGFSAKLAEPLASPFAGREAWMALELVPGSLHGVAGWVCYPPPFGFHPPQLPLRVVSGNFAVCKLPTGSPIPAWVKTDDFFSLTRTTAELTVVCRQAVVPDGVVCEPSWRCLQVAGAMPFTLVGVLASLTTPIAQAGVGIFAFSTFDTDYLLIKDTDFPKALAALRAVGHRVFVEGFTA